MVTLIAWLEHIGVAAVFVFVLVEQGGLPLPAYPLLIIAGVWSARGGAPIAWITGVTVAACLIADLAWHAAGAEVVVYCSCPTEATSARLAKRLMTVGFDPVRPLADAIHAWQDAGLAVERS